MTTAAAKRHLDRLSTYPCAVCGTQMAHCHHPRAAAGMGQRASDFLAIPLCYECHQGQHGIHGDRGAWKLRKMDEWDAVAKVIEWMELSR